LSEIALQCATWLRKFIVVLNQPQSVLLKVLMMDIIETIKEQVESNPILLYMKGSPNQPQCGFSARTVQSLMSCGERFAFVDILSNPDIRANLPAYANWPTFPQLWVGGELVGGCDIVCDMFEKGELQKLVKEAAAQAPAENS
jgi:monothiol glutaredoxin